MSEENELMKKKTTKLSIVIPCYNSEQYIEACLESIALQMEPAVEVICVDDGSGDNTAKIIGKYVNKGIKLIKKEHQGISAAKKAGTDISVGEYIYFMDSDDWLEDGAIHKIMDSISDDDIDGVFWNYFIHKGTTISTCRLPMSSGIYTREVFLNNLYDIANSRNVFNWAQWSYVTKRDIITKVIGDVFDDLKKYEDVQATWKCLLKMRKICILDDVLYHYRFSNNSTGRSKYLFALADLNKIYLDLLMDNQLVDGYEKILNIQLRYVFFDLVHSVATFSNERQDFYMFPYELIPSNSRVIIYGAGIVGKSYFRQIRANHYCDIVAWCDQNMDSTYMGYAITLLKKSIGIEFDYLLIANTHYEEAELIKQRIVDDFRMKSEKIVTCIPHRISHYSNLENG